MILHDLWRGARAGLLGGVLAIGCSGTGLAPIPVGDACERAQKTLDALECPWRANSAKEPWASSCHYLADHGYPRILVVADCMAAAPSCAAAKETCR